MTKRTIILAHATARSRAEEAVRTAPDGYVVTIGEATKRRIQEERYHAMLGDIAQQCDYHGRKLPLEPWKRLLVEAMVHILRSQARAAGESDPFPEGGQLLPSLDNLRIVQVEVLTRDFTVSQASAFIEHLFAFGADRGVVWSDPLERAG